MTIPQLRMLIPLLVLPMFGWNSAAQAHGANLQYRTATAFEIQATYEGGVPMARAQVSAYGPDDPSTPWITGETDEQGRFVFVPDRAQVGNWEVKVRQGGHGKVISISTQQIAAEAKQASDRPTEWSSTESENYTPLQKTVMAVTGVWGLVGTALFFMRRPSDSH